MIVVNKDWCKGCKICIECCPVHALTESTKANKRGVHPPKLAEDHRCIACRLCELQCPDMAIFVLSDNNQSSSKGQS